MENIAVQQLDTASASSIDSALEDIFLVPYETLTICRPLGPYGRMLSLTPSVRSAPSPEFLFRLLTPHASHQSVVRKAAGDQFKNLENLIRGRHQSSATTRQVLAARLQCSLDFVAELDGSAPDGPLMPGLQQLVQLFEGIPSWLSEMVLSVNIPCPSCGANVIEDVDAWWKTHAPTIGEPEYRFVERLLRAVMGARLCELIAHHFATGAHPPSLRNLSGLTNPRRHAIGHWLTEIMSQLNLTSLSQLSAHMQLKGYDQNAYTHGRLRKWSAGLEAMPLTEGLNVARSIGTPPWNERRLCAARTFALVTEFIMASTGADDRVCAQTLLDARLKVLETNTDLVVRHLAVKWSNAATKSGQTATR